MKILVRGFQERCIEWQGALDVNVSASYDENRTLNPNDFDAVAELNADENPEILNAYDDFNGWLLVCAVKKSLLEMLNESPQLQAVKLIGINALPTFIGRKSLEISLSKSELKGEAAQLVQSLGQIPEFVHDRVGMVTPRLVLMIINEAFYTLQEGTATEADIDTGMKLGTNYPFGPFEWCAKIGVSNVYETLDALWNDTREERYKICPLLKERYLEAMIPAGKH